MEPVLQFLPAARGRVAAFPIHTVRGERIVLDAESRWRNSTSRAHLHDLLPEDPDAMRARLGLRSALRTLEIQAARCEAQRPDPGIIDAPSRRLRANRAA